MLSLFYLDPLIIYVGPLYFRFSDWIPQVLFPFYHFSFLIIDLSKQITSFFSLQLILQQVILTYSQSTFHSTLFYPSTYLLNFFHLHFHSFYQMDLQIHLFEYLILLFIFSTHQEDLNQNQSHLHLFSFKLEVNQTPSFLLII